MIFYVSDVYPENFVFQIFTNFLNFVKITLLFSIFYCLSWLYFEFLNFKRAVLIVCRILFLNKALEQPHYISNVRYITWFLYYIIISWNSMIMFLKYFHRKKFLQNIFFASVGSTHTLLHFIRRNFCKLIFCEDSH